MKLFLCGGCNRHVKDAESACPFCGARVASAPCLDGSRTLRRMSRAAMMASASTALALASCSTYGQGPFCGDEVVLSSPCRLAIESSTCAGATSTCDASGPSGECTVGPIAQNCSISVRLGDGTRQSIDITVQPAPGSCPNAKVVVAPGTQTHVFGSPTCPLPKLDAGLDADDADDAMVDDAADGADDSGDAALD